jgi:uncharacterized protein (TIGR00251 family)
VLVDVQVAPRASRDRIGALHGDRIKVQLTAPPVEGAANQALCRLIADTLGLAPSRVAVIRGETSRKKTVRCDGVTLDVARSRLETVQ